MEAGTNTPITQRRSRWSDHRFAVRDTDCSPFLLTAELMTPVILNRPICLDALICLAVIKELMGPTYWLQSMKRPRINRPPLPLKKMQTGRRKWTYWSASASIIGDDKDRDTFWINRRWEWKPAYMRFARIQGRSKVDEKAGSFKSWRVPFETISVPEVRWFGCGDPDMCLWLLNRHVVSLGKKINAGWGMIRRWRYEKVSSKRDYSCWNFGDENGRVCMRPIPIEQDEAGRYDMVDVCTYRPPYWLLESARLCVVPGAREL